MPRGTQLSDYEKGVIDDLREQKMTYQFIGTFLNRSFSVVRNYLNNKESYGSNRRSGRRPLLSDRAKSRVIRYAKSTQFSRSKIANDLNLKVSKWTIGRALKSDPNIKRKKKKQRSVLKDHHKVCRLSWAKKVMS
jgi:IS30 family transposase